MKKIILFVTFLINFSVSAETLNECVATAKTYGDGRGRVHISNHCKDLILNSSFLYSYKDYVNKDIVVYGHRNYLFMYLGSESNMKDKVKNLPRELMVTGEQNRLREVLALDVDFKNKTLVVLAIDASSGKKAIFTYRLWAGGNVSPIRKLYSDEVQNATNVRVNQDSSEIYVIFKGEAKIKTFRILGDIDGRRPGQETTVLKQLSGPATLLTSPRDIAFNPESNSFYVLDMATRKIYEFNNLELGNIVPTQTRAIPDKLNFYQIRFDPLTKGLKLLDNTGVEVEVSL